MSFAISRTSVARVHQPCLNRACIMCQAVWCNCFENCSPTWMRGRAQVVDVEPRPPGMNQTEVTEMLHEIRIGTAVSGSSCAEIDPQRCAAQASVFTCERNEGKFLARFSHNRKHHSWTRELRTMSGTMQETKGDLHQKKTTLLDKV